MSNQSQIRIVPILQGLKIFFYAVLPEVMIRAYYHWNHLLIYQKIHMMRKQHLVKSTAI